MAAGGVLCQPHCQYRLEISKPKFGIYKSKQHVIILGISAIFGAFIDRPLILRHYWRMKNVPPLLKEIKAARLAKGLTQEDFARATGIPRRTYQRLESGDPGSRIDTLFRALNALGLTIKTASRGRPTLDELSALYGDDA